MQTLPTKAQLRPLFRKKRRSLSPAEVVKASIAICNHVMPFLKKSTSVVGYLAFDNEPSIEPVLKTALACGKQVLLPRHNGDTYGLVAIRNFENDLDTGLEIGPHGIRQPKASCPIYTGTPDLWLVPGLAFDKGGYRLGLGKGVYDLLLGQQPGLFLGIAYAWQVVDTLPRDDWDKALRGVVTELGVL